MAGKALVTIGTDGVVDYVQVPDGTKYMLGPVSVLQLLNGLLPTRQLRKSLDEFLETGRVLVSADIEEMWKRLPFRRSRFSSSNPLIGGALRKEPSMKTASYDTFSEHVQLAEQIVSKIASTDERIDALVRGGKRFDAIRAKTDLLRIAARVSDLTQEVDLAQPWVGDDLRHLERRASEIGALFGVDD